MSTAHIPESPGRLTVPVLFATSGRFFLHHLCSAGVFLGSLFVRNGCFADDAEPAGALRTTRRGEWPVAFDFGQVFPWEIYLDAQFTMLAHLAGVRTLRPGSGRFARMLLDYGALRLRPARRRSAPGTGRDKVVMTVDMIRRCCHDRNRSAFAPSFGVGATVAPGIHDGPLRTRPRRGRVGRSRAGGREGSV